MDRAYVVEIESIKSRRGETIHYIGGESPHLEISSPLVVAPRIDATEWRRRLDIKYRNPDYVEPPPTYGVVEDEPETWWLEIALTQEDHERIVTCLEEAGEWRLAEKIGEWKSGW